MDWLFLFLGLSLTFGGCYCCAQGCSRCSDGSDTATLQIDIADFANDESTGCCAALNQSYELTQDGGRCDFSVTYNNGACATAACTSCGDGDDVQCIRSCNESPTTVCDPAGGGSACSNVGAVDYNTDCDRCDATEGATIIPEESGSIVGFCDCDCTISSPLQIWDTDIMLVDHPEATWASPGDSVYYCDCTPNLACTATLVNSSITINASLVLDGADAKLELDGFILGRAFAGGIAFTGDPVVCATEMNALALTVGNSYAPGGEDILLNYCSGAYAYCLCTEPATMTVTYIP